MRRFYTYALLLGIMTGVCACQGGNNEPVEEEGMGGTGSIACAPNVVEVDDAGGYTFVAVQSKKAWTVSANRAWVHVTPEKADGDNTPMITVDAGYADVAVLTFTSGKASAKVLVGRGMEPPVYTLKTADSVQGGLPGLFSVAPNRRVAFSQGNLQYCAATNRWQFAAHQQDVIGDANAGISATYTGWIDLFGWGTSGWNSGALSYQPWSTSEQDYEYWPGNNSSKSLTQDCAQADWGVCNAIYNGGNTAGMWRTLTGDELEYLFFHRPNARYLRGYGSLDNVRGVFLLPDNWYYLSNTYLNPGLSWTDNTLNNAQFAEFQQSGAVFLPCGGFRSGLNVLAANMPYVYGYYWTSTAADATNAYGFDLNNGVAKYAMPRHTGANVRLVRDYVEQQAQ